MRTVGILSIDIKIAIVSPRAVLQSVYVGYCHEY